MEKDPPKDRWEGKEWFTQKEAASYLGVSKGSLKGWMLMPDLNHLPYHKWPGKKGGLRYHRSDLDAWKQRTRRVAA